MSTRLHSWHWFRLRILVLDHVRRSEYVLLLIVPHM